MQCNAILQAELAQMSRNGSGLWIVKPVSSSRGRGIFIVNDVRQIPPQYKAVACRYIANPLLLDRKAVRLTDSLVDSTAVVPVGTVE